MKIDANHAKLGFLWGWLLTLVSPAVFGQQSLEVVEKAVAEKWSKVKSMSATLVSETEFEGDPRKAFGTIEYMNEGGRELVRLEMTMQRFLPDRIAEAKSLMLYDGEMLYTLTDHSGQYGAAKSKPENLNIAPGGRRFFQLLKKNSLVRVLPDEKQNGKDCYVLEGRPIEPSPQTASVVKFFLSKETGMMVKSVGTDVDGKIVISNTYSDIRLNDPVSVDRFKFEPPPGVEVIDATKQPLLSTP